MFETSPATLDSDGSTSQTLLEGVRLRDPDAWRRFVHLYGPVIYRWACHSQLQSHDAADIAQEVFQAVSTSIVRFRHGHTGETFRGWLRTITSNKVRDHFRNRRKEVNASNEAVEDVEAPVESVDDDPRPGDELAHRALTLIQTEFETRTWQAFMGCAVSGRTAADMAAELNMTVAAVHKAKSRVLHRLRRELDGLLD